VSLRFFCAAKAAAISAVGAVLAGGLMGFASLSASNAHADPRPCCVAGDPISVNVGNMFQEIVDYAGDGPDALEFIRYYNSIGLQTYGPLAPLGIRWRSNYDRYLVIVANATAAVAERGDGQVVGFRVSNGVGAPDSDMDLTLVQSGDAWVLTDSDGTVETYGRPDDTGRLRVLTIKAADGYTQTLSYNAANQLLSVTDSHDRTLKFGYEKWTLSTVTTPDGETLTYGHNSSAPAISNDRLVSVSYSASPDKDRTYLYENATFTNLLTGVADAAGNRITTWTYDEFGRATSSLHGADLTTVAYGKQQPDGILVNTVTERGEETVYKMRILQNVPKIIEIDRLGTPTRPASTELFSYDANGYLASKTAANGKVTTYVPHTQYQWP
jgi:YD repeat-containing protein